MNNTTFTEGLMQKIGPYRVEKRLGAGGMGEVYRAFDERLGRSVALKQILPERAANARARGRFRREARSAARLNHPSIVKVHDILARDDGDWIVMELVEGETLAKLLESGPLPIDRALALARELATALAVAHGEGIVHRDLKPNNVLITPGGHLKILDFGLAKQVLQPQESSISIEGQLLGTPRAMSPEQAMGRKVDLRSDLFSLGSLLYEVVTGVAPFRGQGPLETLRMVCTHLPPPVYEWVPTVPEGFSQVLQHLMQKDPAHRPQTAAEVVAAIEHLSAEPEDSIETLVGDDLTLVDGALAVGGEKRQVTVVGCELVSTDDRAGSLDPELLFEVIGEFEGMVREVVHRYGGHVDNVLGHRVMLYFGYPKAHEDDAERALRTARELRSRVPSSDTLSLRTGIHTGPGVVLGREIEERQLVLGPTLDRVLKLQTEAAPGEILLSPSTRALLRGAYLGELSDIEELRISDAEESEGVGDIGSSSPWNEERTAFIGREQELMLLSECVGKAKGGSGQAVLLCGEAGIGKSRLIHHLRQHTADSEMQWMHAYGSPFTQGSPFSPLIPLLHKILLIEDGLGLEDHEKFEHMRQALQEIVPEFREAAALLAIILGIHLPGDEAGLGMSPQKQRQMTLVLLAKIFSKLADESPMVLVIEDLHWIDPSTLDVLESILLEIQRTPIVLLMSYRPNFKPRWEATNHTTTIHLERLASSEVSVLITKVTGNKELPEGVARQILAKTDGIPLFVEELTKNILESGILEERKDEYVLIGSLEDIAIPTTLRDSLTARLDRLGNAKTIAQLASTVGREFSYDLLQKVADLDDISLEKGLDRLLAAGLIFKRGLMARRRFIFKHALIQDAAYSSVLQGQRASYHSKIGKVLVDYFPNVVENKPEIIAHHYTAASLNREAIDYWSKAGKLALERSADTNAREHLDKGISLLDSLPDDEARDSIEAELQISLGATLMALEGFASQSAGDANIKARTLCEKTGDERELFWIMRNLWLYHVSRSELDKALEIAKQLMGMSTDTAHVDAKITAHNVLAASHQWLGQFEPARELLLGGLELDSLDRHQAFSLSTDPGVENICNLATNSWYSGYPLQAREYADQAALLANQISHSFSIAIAYFHQAWISNLIRDRERLMDESRKTITFCEERGFPLWGSLSHIMLGWAKAMSGVDEGQGFTGSQAYDDGIFHIEKGIEWFRNTGATLTLTFALADLAEVHMSYGNLDRADATLDEAFTIVEKTGERFWQAELWRLRGELALLHHGLSTEASLISQAKGSFEKAIAVAADQNARSWGLRATNSLARLLIKNGSAHEATERLLPVYTEFSKGLSTPDLQEASRILAVL